MAAGFAQMNVPGEYDKAKEWIAVFQGLEDVERESDQMVGRLQLDRTHLFRDLSSDGSAPGRLDAVSNL